VGEDAVKDNDDNRRRVRKMSEEDPEPEPEDTTVEEDEFYLNPSVCDDASSSIGSLESVFSAFDASLVVADGSL